MSRGLAYKFEREKKEQRDKHCNSPFCCGNPRRQRGQRQITLQERKIDITERELIEDLSI